MTEAPFAVGTRTSRRCGEAVAGRLKEAAGPKGRIPKSKSDAGQLSAGGFLILILAVVFSFTGAVEEGKEAEISNLIKIKGTNCLMQPVAGIGSKL